MEDVEIPSYQGTSFRYWLENQREIGLQLVLFCTAWKAPDTDCGELTDRSVASPRLVPKL